MMFITVKFGDDNYALFNPNCSIINLLDNIRRRCNCGQETAIDLSDENGVIQKLFEKSHQNASSILKGRGVYILLRVEKVGDQPCTYSPLLNGLEITNPALLAKLRNISKPEDDLPKQNSQQRKKSPWDRTNARKLASRAAKEASVVSAIKTNVETARENGQRDEKYSSLGGGGGGERRTGKQRKPVSIKT